MNNWKIILACVVIFGAGMVSGTLVSKQNHPQPPPAMRPQPVVDPGTHSVPTNTVPATPKSSFPPHLPEILSKQFVQRMNKELQLKPEQHEAIQKIIGESQSRMRNVIQETRQEILKTLTPEQSKTFENMGKGGRKNFSNSLRPDRPAVLPPATNDAGTNAQAGQ